VSTLDVLQPHPHARAVLGSALADGRRPSHAYLFHGPAGAGKRTAARRLAADLLAGDDEDARRRALAGAHPDLTWVCPSGAHEMLVGDIEEPVIAAATRTPFESSVRVFVLERADTLIEQAANKLLKTLEEPPPFVHLILITDRLADVLPTIASRCQLVRFEPPPIEEVAARLERHGVEPATAGACARLALGDARRALELALGDGPALRAAAEAFATAALQGDLSGRPWEALMAIRRVRGDAAVAALEAEHAERLEVTAKKDRRRLETEHAERGRRVRRRAETGALDLGLQVTGFWLRDLAAVLWGAEDLVAATDRLPQLRAAAADRDPAKLRRGVELVEETRQGAIYNVTEELALEALASRLLRVLA
jgi:DNA polymerase III subunit delta'